MSENLISLTVKLFAAYQEAYGVPEIKLQLPAGSPVEAVLDYILREHPDLEKWRSVTRFGVNLEFVCPETLLQEGDEVVLIPPVSGG
ncbi:MoaD/ThiS family protein [Ancylothrix sp. C2]|uniref:MoaD/ThiS family protein n=1 Tax=Ancylothrix sp. D3o TaxID=2953691 RepID=UPI0021BABF42|nr:MoaD/ThiS family protein [Ancylothrix sp. D3o]MCT7951349.1 MoaD/ThiS family protein [Ancylothrix sp. D3o]